MSDRYWEGYRDGVDELTIEMQPELERLRAIEKAARALVEDEFFAWATANYDKWIELKQALEPKECEHGKPMNDYCQPCGRVNGG